MSKNRRKILPVLPLVGIALVGAMVLLSSNAQANLGECSQPFSAGSDPSASDCLFILSAAVGNSTCDNPCICAPKGTLPARATDALLCLNFSVGAAIADNCPCTDLKDAAYQFTPATDVTNPDIDDQFVATNYLGAFDQGVSPTTGDWTTGWTVELHGNFFVWEPATGGTLNGATPTATGTCPAGTTDVGDEAIPGGGAMDNCQLAARYAVDGSSLTLTNDNIYTLGGAGNQGTFIGDGDAAGKTPATASNVTLNIEQGALILGVPSEALKVTRGSKINITGTAVDPVVMTSQTQFDDWQAGGDGDTAGAQWGGLVVTGFAETNTCNNLVSCDALVEGVINPFNWGGFDDTDDSGTITYVVVDKGGFGLAPASEINAITLYGIGYNTDFSFMQANDNTDDGIEVFGGEAVFDHVVSTNNFDDSLDTDEGFRGGFQFALVKQSTVEADKGYEFDNKVIADAPISEATYANVTVLNSTATTGNPVGMGPRSGSGGYFWNGIISKPELAAIRSEAGTVKLNGGVPTGASADDGILRIKNFLIFATLPGVNYASTLAGGETVADVQSWYEADADNRKDVDPTLSATGYPGSPDNP